MLRDSLLNGSEGAEVTSCCADDANDCGEEQNPEALKTREDDSRQEHEKGASEENLSTTEAVGDQGQEGAEEHISKQRQGEEDA